MAKVLVTQSKLTAIGNAIRTKLSEQDTYTLDQMPTKIASISTGVVPVSMAVTGSWTNEQLIGQAPDTTGLTFTVTYQTKQVTPSVSPATYSSTGSQTVTFSYTENGTTVTASKTATVIRKPVSLSVSGSWSKTQYVGSAMDTTGLTFTVTYNNGSTATVTPTKSPSTWTSSGTQTATFTYTESGTTVSTTKTATVVAVALSSIAVSGSWTNTQYTDTAVDTTGLTVTATFNNGTTSNVTSSATVSPSTWSSTAGTQTATFSYTYNGVTKSATKTASVAEKQRIYGVNWDGTSTTLLSRTDDSASFTNPNPYYSGMSGSPSSPFDNIAPWSEMTAVEDSEAGTLIKIPKFYYKWTRTGDAMKLQISPTSFTGSLVSPAHADRGDGKGERDVVYVGKYHCCSTNYKSTTGVNQQVNIQRSTARSSISALGSTIWQWDYAMVWTIRMLYLVEYANWNSQTTIGYGCSAGSRAKNGRTDSISYHTGTTASARTSYGFTKYRNIEGLWDNVTDWCDGIYYKSNGVNIIKNPASFSDSSGGTVVATIPATVNGEIKSWTNPTASGMEYALTPASSYSDSNYATYIADIALVRTARPCVFVGGSDSRYQDYGLFFTSCDIESHAYTNIGSRVQKLP